MSTIVTPSSVPPNNDGEENSSGVEVENDNEEEKSSGEEIVR